MIIVGIDPGVRGGLAVIPKYDFKATMVYDRTKMTLGDVAAIFQEYRDNDLIVEVFLENPNLPQFNFSNKGRGFNLAAHHKLSKSVGQYEGVCHAFGYIPTLISPVKWQNRLNCRTLGDKKVTREYAIKLFGFLKRTMKNGESKSLVTHNVADALLIALYGYLQHAEDKYIPRIIKEGLEEGGKYHDRTRNRKSSIVSSQYGLRGAPSMRRLPPGGKRRTRLV